MRSPDRFFAIHRTLTLPGDRAVTDGVVADAHRGPSPELAEFLAAWPGAWYWGDDARSRLVLVEGTAPARPERWLWHGALLLATVVSTLGAGAVLAGAWRPIPHAGFGGAILSLLEFIAWVWANPTRALLPGVPFAVPLLAILLVHELGHYVAARRYAIDVSPPYFLPVPPSWSPIGNLGAFLRIRSAVYDRRQLLDVGASGPVAGFVVALAVLIWGLSHSFRLAGLEVDAPAMILLAGRPLFLGESLLVGWLDQWLVPGVGPVLLSPAAFAGWVGMFVTALNLLPLSQLDGGHVLYGLAGRRQAMLSLLVVAVLLVLARQAPVWYLWIGLTFVIGGGRWAHEAVVVPERPVLRAGRWLGWCCLVIFALTFVPVPFPS
ncbi:MAG TPA: site-2 protease family protein [Gemmatimonadales bacterium]|nr:site-2 protease family protein [Gemmatimonadales bacterium]